MQNRKQATKDTKGRFNCSPGQLRHWFTRHIWVGVTLVIFVVLLLIDLSPVGGSIRFYSKWVECGQKPVAEANWSGFGSRVISYTEPAAFEPLRFGQPTYFCTPLEAEKAGYSANPNQYEFPELDKLNK